MPAVKIERYDESNSVEAVINFGAWRAAQFFAGAGAVPTVDYLSFKKLYRFALPWPSNCQLPDSR
jgi:hypothetical protein